MELQPTSASWRWARTCWSRSCPGMATTSRTRFLFPSVWWQMSGLPPSISRNCRWLRAIPSSAPEEITRDISNLSEVAARPSRRVGHHLYRRGSRGGRRAGRQGDAQGRNADDPGREAAARDLRREGLGREGHQPARAFGHFGHGDRRAGVHARRHRARQARPADHR